MTITLFKFKKQNYVTLNDDEAKCRFTGDVKIYLISVP